MDLSKYDGLKLEIYENGSFVFHTKKSVTTAYPNPQGSLIEVLESVDAFVRYVEIKFAEMSEGDKTLILAVFPNFFDRIRDGSICMWPEKIFARAFYKLCQTDLLDNCSRCGGIGEHSYNTQSGSVCFKCRGFKKQMPKKVTKKFWETVTKHFEENPS